MKAAAFGYACPASIAEAIGLLAAGEGDARIIAGGQSLGPMLNLRLAQPATLVDIRRIAELRAVRVDRHAVVLGAGVTHAEIEDGAAPTVPWLAEVARGIAFRPVRNRGTIGGSLAHADPAADWPTALMALGATVQIASAAGIRSCPLDAFFTGAYATTVEPDELVQSVRVPIPSQDARFGFYKFCRRLGEFAEASAAACVDPARGGLRIVIGALDGAPALLGPLCAVDAGSGTPRFADAAIRNAVAAAAPDRDEDARHLTCVAVRRALAALH
jgi:carbon-monoxide dehydrogenase medium subunit